jgi:hypothetical protein
MNQDDEATTEEGRHTDPLIGLCREYERRIEAMQEQQRKIYIEWCIQTKAGQSVYNSDKVKIDEAHWVFKVILDGQSNSLMVYV